MPRLQTGIAQRRGRFTFAMLLMVLLAWASGVDAAEIILQNDSIATPGAGTPLLQFVPGERAAAWFTSPVAGDIVGVQILWDSLFGGNPAQVEMGIDVFAAGAFPTPGASLATIVGPTLVNATPGMNINEFRHLDPPADTASLQVPVIAGQSFVVALEFLNQSVPGPFGSGIEIDGDGCQANTNSVFAQPGGWTDACAAGVTGDFGIRAIINPIPEPGTVALMLVGVAALCGVCRSRAAP